MRKICLLAFIAWLFSAPCLQAQGNTVPTGSPVAQKKANHPRAYLGLSSGLNNESGILGFSFEVPLAHSFTVGAGVGVSTWGTKVFGEARYYFKPTLLGWAIGAGITHSTGVTAVKHKHDTIYGKEDVTLDLNPQTNIFIAAYHFWQIGRGRNRFYLTAGYSVPFQHPSYSEVLGDPLTATADDHVKRLAPGGLIAAFGFSFGIR